MKMAAKYGLLVPIVVMAALVTSCISDTKGDDEQTPKGMRAYADVTLAKEVSAQSRATLNNSDHWTIASFNSGDETGMYSLAGKQNPDNPADFSLSVVNERMSYEGKIGDAYRFGTSGIVIDPETVNSQASLMYYPYYPDMPDPADATGLPGMPLRREDGGMEKCIDFMYTMDPNSLLPTVNNRIPLTNGVLTPKFYHYFVNLILQRGAGFESAPDRRIWVVMKNPYTDVRFKRTDNSTYSTHAYVLQYNPDVFEVEGVDLMVDINKLPYKTPDGDFVDDGLEEQEPFNVNRYALWETWEGSKYSGIESRYAVIPPKEDVYFIYIQDNYGNWQKVSDFKLDDGKQGARGYSYTLTIMLVGTKVVVRPVAIESWNEEINIADIRKVGIDDYSEYFRWVSTYNAYIEDNRNESYVEELMKYGDAKMNTETNEISWTFYINNDIEFRDDHIADFAQIKQLDDAIEGSSTYVNYSISNIRDTMVGRMGANGVIKALDFKDIYLVQPESAGLQPYSALIGEMAGGTIERCNVLNGVLVSRNEVGMVAGKVSGGTVINCNISGDVIGKSTAAGPDYNGMFGTVEGTVDVINCKTAGLQFIEN